MAIQAKVDDVADAQCVDVSQLRFRSADRMWLSGHRADANCKCFRIGHHSLDSGFGGGPRRGTRLIGADSFPRISNPRFPSASRALDVALPDRRASFSSFVVSMPYLISEIASGIIPDPARSGLAAFKMPSC